MEISNDYLKAAFEKSPIKKCSIEGVSYGVDIENQKIHRYLGTVQKEEATKEQAQSILSCFEAMKNQMTGVVSEHLFQEIKSTCTRYL